jgi:nitrate/nitrite-specific signal transduction histidine kinase
MPWMPWPPGITLTGSRVAATEELGELVRSFNRMAEDLEESRALAETSTTQLSAANRALEERRSELETVLETIPSAVVTLDPRCASCRRIAPRATCSARASTTTLQACRWSRFCPARSPMS